MPYFAAVFAQTDEGWMAAEAELAESETTEDVTDLLREAALETSGGPVLLLVEENDAWFGVLRLDGEDDPRVFLSDGSAAHNSALGGLLTELTEPVGEHTGPAADGDPLGDPALLADLGTDETRLLRLSERAIPTDALTDIAEHAGFTEELDSLRA
ncbi:tRNA adenosine deaminase-associated protein [Actinocorallia populi]|uniref:tRNA adenosine deaminase-associated protein n=1 Tax=Actinocorallia populi TaxID=2079200 RepID=UPI000D08CADF|nr:tRNA adenosine deaminase-associated protein [Actinocorallia populi]